MHCIHCGTQLPEGAKFCTSCGRPVQAAAADDTFVTDQPDAGEPAEESAEGGAEAYTPPANASEGYKAASAQLPPSYSNPNYSSQAKSAYTVPTESSSNVLAIAGFVCSLVFLPIGVGVLTAVAGFVLSIMGLNNAKKLPENRGHGLALAGTIISAIRIALILIGAVALFALMVRGAGRAGYEIISNWSEYWPFSH